MKEMLDKTIIESTENKANSSTDLVEISSLKKGDKFVLPNDYNIRYTQYMYTYEGKSPLNALEIKAVNNTVFSTVYFPRYIKVIKL